MSYHTENFSNNTKVYYANPSDNYYWDSPEVKNMFALATKETIRSCLLRMMEKFGDAVYNNDIILLLIDDTKDVNFSTIRQRLMLRHRCIHLCKVYENTLQYMNIRT